MAAPAAPILIVHVWPLMFHGPGASSSGSMRHMLAKLSPTHKWRTGWPVNALIAVPFIMMPAVGPVLRLSGPGPESRSVFVVGLTGVCALAEVAALRAIMRQSHMIRRERCCVQHRGRASVVEGDLIFLPSWYLFFSVSHLFLSRKFLSASGKNAGPNGPAAQQ